MREGMTQIGRGAFRREGRWWVAYYAMPDTMKEAIELGRIRMAAVEQNPKVKDGFIALVRELIADIIEESTGVRPTWPDAPQPAPEHERAGEA
jgi:hypothetical protein